MKKRASIRDVAKAAGVSIATVSYVLKGIGKVSEPTIKRVWDVVNELNYSPNPYARKIFGKEPVERTETGFLMRISYWPSQAPVELEIEKTILFSFETACREHDYLGTNYLYRHEKGFHCRQLVSGLVDGVLLGTSHYEIIQSVRDRVPAVMVNLDIEPEEIGMPVVAADEVSGIVQVLKKLQSCGMGGNMAVVTGLYAQQSADSLDSKRKKSMNEAAETCGIPVKPEHCLTVETSTSTTEQDMSVVAEKMEKLIRDEKIRIIGSVDLDLWALANALKKRGFRLPEDITIVGISAMNFVRPGIVTIAPDYTSLINKSVEVLKKYIKGEVSGNEKYYIPVSPIDFAGIEKTK